MPSVPSPSPPVGPAELAHRTGQFYEPRRADCPWCGARRLRPAQDRRPGGPTLDRCRDCAHVFQNPRPLRTGRAPDRTPRRHRSTARALLPFPEPESWLDVGTGSGSFPAIAREFFPYTAFDGVDTDRRRLLWAYRAGHVEEAHVGRLTDPRVAARLRARYDVVSLLHHLESAPDPRAELHAAVTVLRPGGHLLLELAPPPTGWHAVRTDQIHLFPPENIEAELRSRGCTILPAPTRVARLTARGRLLARHDRPAG